MGPRLRPHPLAGRVGEGPPIAPAGWRWKAGSRASDMYFYSPSGETFRSRVHLHQYLASNPSSPHVSEFKWIFEEHEYENGSLPGVEKNSTRRFSSIDGVSKRLKLQDEAFPKKSLTLTSILSSTTCDQILCIDSEAVESVEEIKQKSEEDLEELQQLLIRKLGEEGGLSVKKYSEKILRIFVFILRNQLPSSCVKKEELIKVCSWYCKNKHFHCAAETERIETFLKSCENNSKPENSGDEKGTTKKGCECESCKDVDFCWGCQCNICKQDVNDSKLYIRCQVCLHVTHLECAVESKRAGVVKEVELDGEFLCSSCMQRVDLIWLWKEKLKSAAAATEEKLIKQELSYAMMIMNGTCRRIYRAVHERVAEILHSLENGSGAARARSDLEDIVSSIDEKGEITGVMEAKLDLYKRKAGIDYVEWLKAEKHVEAQRLLLEQISEQLNAAEEEANIKAAYASSSRMMMETSERRLESISEMNDGISERRCFIEELMQLHSLQRKLGGVKCETIEDYLREMSDIIERMKEQRKKVEYSKNYSCL